MREISAVMSLTAFAIFSAQETVDRPSGPGRKNTGSLGSDNSFT
jgi:hypothetical protein